MLGTKEMDRLESDADANAVTPRCRRQPLLNLRKRGLAYRDKIWRLTMVVVQMAIDSLRGSYTCPPFVEASSHSLYKVVRTAGKDKASVKSRKTKWQESDGSWEWIEEE